MVRVASQIAGAEINFPVYCAVKTGWPSGKIKLDVLIYITLYARINSIWV